MQCYSLVLIHWPLPSILIIYSDGFRKSSEKQEKLLALHFSINSKQTDRSCIPHLSKLASFNSRCQYGYSLFLSFHRNKNM